MFERSLHLPLNTIGAHGASLCLTEIKTSLCSGLGMTNRIIRIGGASGYWGDSAKATPQLLSEDNLDYLVYDYLAEVTMSILARARAEDESKGYAVDFVSRVLEPNIEEISRQQIKVISNAGGVNPRSCASHIRDILAKKGLDLKVAVVTGDSLDDEVEALSGLGVTEMFSGASFPSPESVVSANAYLGALPIAVALERGADIVITGRCVDSAVTLGACIFEFGWGQHDLDQLAQGSLAGHLIECGTQVTGGNHTDWHLVADSLEGAGYPIAEVSADGTFYITKAAGTGGIVSRATVAEQLVYEIGDPRAYVLPDVVCDFTSVRVREVTSNKVFVSGARGLPPTDQLKVSLTHYDGYRAGHILTFYGPDAELRANCFAEMVFKRVDRALQSSGLEKLARKSTEIIGSESHFGNARRVGRSREVDLKIAATHKSVKGVGLFIKEMMGLALTAPPGLTIFTAVRPKPSPIVRLFSFLISKGNLHVQVEDDLGAQEVMFSTENRTELSGSAYPQPDFPSMDKGISKEWMNVALGDLAWTRSGDKGNNANIGIIARSPEFLPLIAEAVSEEVIEDLFSHFLEGPVERFYLPGIHALNFLLHDVLDGGGVASLRMDAQGKGFSQLILDYPIPVPLELAEEFNLSPIREEGKN